MNGVLTALLLALTLPLLMGSWRASLLGLAAQGALLGWLQLKHLAVLNVTLAIQLLDVVLLRGILAPALLWTVLAQRQAPRRNDVLAPNLLSWTAAGALVVAAFQFANAMEPDQPAVRAHVAVAATAVLLALLVLASASTPLSQVVGLLRLENGVLLLETTLHHLPSPVLQGGLTVTYLGTVLVCRHFLHQSAAPAATPPQPAQDQRGAP